MGELRKTVNRQTLAAVTGPTGREPNPLTSDTKALWAAAPDAMRVSRADGRREMAPPRSTDPNIHPAGNGDVLLAWHQADRCEECEAGAECYIWSLRSHLHGLRLPFIPERRPVERVDPEAHSWRPADAGTEAGRAHIEQVRDLLRAGVLLPCRDPLDPDECLVITPSHTTPKQGIKLETPEKAAIEDGDQKQMAALAHGRADSIYTGTEVEAGGRRWTPAAFAAAQAAHRHGPIKWRLVVSMNLTLNELVEDWDFRYVDFGELFGPTWTTSDHVGKNDLVKGFYAVNVAEHERKYLCIRDPGDATGRTVLRYARLPMGFKLAPAIFSAVTAELERHFNRSEHARLGAVFGFYVDDLGLKGDGPSGRAAAAQEYVRREAPRADFRWGTEADKDVPAAQRNEIVGRRFDSNVNGEPQVSVGAKSLYTTLVDLALIRTAIERAPDRARFTTDSLRSTAGRASWVAQNSFAARLRTGSLWYAATRAGHSSDGTVRVAGVRGLLRDVSWFLEQAAVGRLRGERRIRPGALTRAGARQVYSDASGAVGAGGGAIYDGRGLWHQFTGAEVGWSIQAKELSPLVAAAERWGAEWTGKVVVFHTDNLGNAYGINNAKALAGPALELLRRLYELADLYNFEPVAVWLPRSHNTRADAISKATSLGEARRNAVACGAVVNETDVASY